MLCRYIFLVTFYVGNKSRNLRAVHLKNRKIISYVRTIFSPKQTQKLSFIRYQTKNNIIPHSIVDF